VQHPSTFFGHTITCGEGHCRNSRGGGPGLLEAVEKRLPLIFKRSFDKANRGSGLVVSAPGSRKGCGRGKR